MDKKSKVFAKYGTVYRIPFIDEVASFSGFGGNFLTDLEKEKGISVEAGTEFYPLKNLKLGLTLFRVDMEDEIEYVYNPVTFTGKNQNTGRLVMMEQKFLFPIYGRSISKYRKLYLS